MVSCAAFAATATLVRTRQALAATNQARFPWQKRHTLMTAPPPKATKPLPQPTFTTTTTSNKPKLTLLYDGECPLCMKEVKFLRSRSAKHNNSLAFVDVASATYDPAQNAGVSYDVAMGRIHAIDHRGEVLSGVKVFRLSYEAVGLGWVYAVTKLPGVSWLAERVYDVWADRRLQLTGRPPLVELLRERERTCRK